MIDQSKTPYEQIGGEDAVKHLVDLFYDNMETLDEAKKIRAMHAKSLRVAREKLFLFLSGWLGGPDLYVEKYGHPMLRRRHLPFPIGIEERDQWMLCMNKALDTMQFEPQMRQHIEQALWRTADHMRNKPEQDPDNGSLKIFTPPSN